MSSKIQIKRGPSTNLKDLLLEIGEPAFTTDTKKLYIGDGSQKTLINPIDKPEGLDVTNQFTKIKVNEYGQVVSLSNVESTDLPSNIPVEKITGLGSSATKNVGTAAGEIPILDSSGKLNATIIPSIAITDTFVAADEEEMLGLAAQIGDICIRADIKETFILQTEPANVMANWIKLETPADVVQSVNGQNGTVVLTSGDITLTGYSKPATGGTIAEVDTISNAIGKLEKNAESYAPMNSPTFTGTVKAPTTLQTENSDIIATTSYVRTAVNAIDLTPYASINSPTFTGIPKAPTAIAGTNTTQLATTEFVTSAVSIIDGGTF